MSARRRLILLAAGGMLLVGALLLDGDRGERDRVERRVDPRPDSVGAFVDSIGVAMHLDYLDTAYANQANVFERLRELGVRHIREGVPVRAPELEKGLREAARLGIRATLVTDLEIPPSEGVAAGLRAMGGQIDGFEGPNELDLRPQPGWEPRLRDYLSQMRAAARAERTAVPIVGPSFVDPSHYDDLDRASFDVASLHPYSGALPPEATLAEQLRRAHDVAPGKRVVFTETGFHNAMAATAGQPPASEEAAAVYLPRSLLWSFAHGVERTFVYELLDEKPDPALTDPEQHFGLLRRDFTPKPAFLAVRNLIRAARESPGPAQGAAPAPEVRSTRSLEVLELTRADGSRLVALWRPVSVWDRQGRAALQPVRTSVRVTWPRPARDLTVLRPSKSAEPVSRHGSAPGLELHPEGDVVLLSYR